MPQYGLHLSRIALLALNKYRVGEKVPIIRTAKEVQPKKTAMKF